MGLFDWFKKKPDTSGRYGNQEDNQLETVLKKASVEPAYHAEFYKLLLAEELVVLTQGSELENGSHTLKEDRTVNIATLADGRIPVFTATDRIFDKGIITKQIPFLAMKGADLFNLAKGATFVLNPYSDYGKELLPGEIANMLDGSIFKANHQQITVKKDAKVLIGQPAIYPQKIVDSLRILFTDKPVVKAAYLGWIHDPSSEIPPHLIFGLDMDADDQSVVNEAGLVVYGHLNSTEVVDFIRMNDGEGLVSYLKETQPFYVRKRN